ncbi:MAG: inositol monophosphatase family protein, partial [Planctomycetota bacterium]
DGTTNFVHQLRSFSVSIGLAYRGELIAGAVLDPLLDECYSAYLGGGATLNGSSISVSQQVELRKSLFVFSFARGVHRDAPDAHRFLNMLQKVGSIRRLGSAALNLCYVACGRTDGYWASQLSQWDVAAGWLIAVEAGATLRGFDGRRPKLIRPKFCCTATPELFEQIQPLLNLEPS